ncbi:hypothetical protein [Poseidonibacter ostreae]|uniref:Uncharacterized protein n=1 Tax=Poseidonibacter ostreae TaxID=2654171 RepID=A0A6L4WXG1_9BACT|nr:hypothetical protein [Poseidonibacter ostreae]KAB7891453.1 hypothetical protein GBG19_01030 [Poseidonibacter ostreae]
MMNINFEEIKNKWITPDGINLREHMHETIKDVENPTKKELKAFNSFLRANKEESVILFHGTSSEYNIKEDGIKKTTARTRKSIQTTLGYVYASVFKELAQIFGEMANPHNEISVYAIKVKVKDLKADLDQLTNKRRWGENENIGNTLADSLVFGRGARIKRNIEDYEVREIWNTKESKLNVA